MPPRTTSHSDWQTTMSKKNSYLRDFADTLGITALMLCAVTVAAMFLYGLFTLIFYFLGDTYGSVALFVIIIFGMVAFTTYLKRVADDEDE